MTKIVMSRTSVRHAALFLLVIACLLSPLGIVLRALHAEGEKNVPVAAPDVESDKVAAIAAEFRVDESGAATYSIPIYAVPGTAGVAPKLSLNYSSQGGYGPLGKGWSIGGLSSVTRCRATREAGDFISGGTPTDGTPKPINFSADDRFCLDGQRLVTRIGGAACAAVSGMTVQTLGTELESFQRVCAYTPTASAANGPAFFTVERKDGSTSWYGDRDNNAAANRADGYVETNAAGHTAKAIVWALTRFQDSSGNYIDYRYHENPGTPAASVEHLLAEVQFTGKTVLAGQGGSASLPYAKVMFNYAMRAEAQRGTGYASGGTFVQRWRLANVMSCITAASGQCSAANQARFYELGYAASASGSGLELLGSVLECRDSSKAVCAAPTTLTWSAGKYEFATYESTANPANLTTDNFRSFKLGDINGDGRLDMALLYQAGTGCVNGSWVVSMVSSFNAAGTPAYPTTQYNCVPAKIYDRGDGTWHLFDYDGDGRDDLFVSSATGQGWKVHPSTGTGFNMSSNLVAGLSPVIPSSDNKDLQVQIADLNGDGLTDIIYPSTTANSMRARLMERQGSGFGWGGERTFTYDETAILQQHGCIVSFPPGPGPYTPQCEWWVSGMPTSKTGFSQLADFNGDAASDLLMRLTVRVRTWTGYPGCIMEPLGMQGRAVRGAPQATMVRHGPSAADLDATANASKAPIDPCYETVEYDNLYALSTGATTGSAIPLGTYASIGAGNPHAITLADANGDGLTDVFIRNTSSTEWTYRLNRGTGFFGGGTLALASFRDQVRFVDVNGDGRADMLQLANIGTYKAYQVRYATADGGYGAVVALPGGNARLCEGSGCNENQRVPIFADFDGDGNLDFQSFNVASSTLGLKVSRSANRFAPRDVVTRIGNGFGANTDVYYAPLTNNALYRRDSGTRNSANWGRGSPVADILMPMYAVAAVSNSSPQDGNPNAMATVYYRYAGAKMQAGGRGFLGFREIVAYDPNQAANQHVVTSTLYAQNFPYVGMPAETVRRVVTSAYAVPACLAAAPTEACFSTPGQAFPALAGTAFYKGTQVWEADRDITAGAAGYAAGTQTPIHVRAAGSEEEARDPFNGGAVTSKVATTFGYGAYGNVTMTDVRTYDGAGALLHTATTANAYAQDNAAKWRLDRITASTVTHSRPGVPNVVRVAAFQHDMGSGTADTGLLRYERSGATGPSGVAAENLLKATQYDQYGNKTRSAACANPATTAACDAALTQFRPGNAFTLHRYSRTTYDSRGRFPVETWESFWDVVAGPVEKRTAVVHQRNQFGDAIHSSDVNGVQTKALYGSLGRQYYAWQQTTPGGVETDAATGMRSLTRYRWCGTGSGQVTCPAGAKFREEVLTTESPAQWTYHDALGREVLKVVENFNVGTNNRYSAVCTQYDLAGRVRRVSNPFFLWASDYGNACAGSGILWTTSTYDVLGRTVAASTPDEAGSGGFATVTTSYNGLTTTVTDPRGKATTSLNWATGELRRVTDANGVQISYSYRADGALSNVDRDAGRGTIRNAFVYDVLGRKIQQSDPDSGVATFEYNALGELIAQLDSAGNRIEHWYDARGRVWRKLVKNAGGTLESESMYLFDAAANGIGKPASESINGTYLGWAGQNDVSLAFGRSYTYDALGRPSGTATYVDGETYATAVAYDARGRAWKVQDASGKWLKTQFTTNGAVKSLCESSASDAVATCPNNATTYLTILETDARGNPLRERRGNSAAMDVVREYWARSGRAAGICAGNATTCNLMDEGYGWDAAGNLSTTQKETRYLEVYTYDNLSRLTLARATMINGATANSTTFNASYDVVGNICAAYATSFVYEGRGGCGTGGIPGSAGTGTTGPHRVRQTTSGTGAVTDYYYDIRGNQTLRDLSGTANDRAIKYSLDDKAHEIALGGTVRTRFWYGSDGQRYKRLHDGKKTIYLGNVEVETVGGVTTVKRNVGGVLQQSIVGSTVTPHYLFHDQLGSVVRTTNASGAIVDNLDYRHFGYRRHFSNPATTTEVGSGVTSRGFTGHEHVDGSGISVVHMNGRIYDPQLHRFLQADPMIQAPANLQSWNAYTYAFNNPLVYTDPTGLFSWKKIWRPLLAIVISVVTYGAATGWATAWLAGTALAGNAIAIGAIAGATAGFVGGAIMTGSFKGALAGAFSGALFGGVAGYYGNNWNWGRVFAESMAGGISSELTGSKFIDGFKLTFAMSVLKYGAVKAREYELAHSRRTPHQVVEGAPGWAGRDGKLAGGRIDQNRWRNYFKRPFDPLDPDFDRMVQEYYSNVRGSPLGGHQGGRGTLFGRAYSPDGVVARTVEAYAGVHDLLNHPFFYNADGTAGRGLGNVLGLLGRAIDGTINALNVAVATPFVLVASVPDHLRWLVTNRSCELDRSCAR